MLKIVLKDGNTFDVPDWATVIIDPLGSDKDGTMTARISITGVTGLLAMKPGETINPETRKLK